MVLILWIIKYEGDYIRYFRLEKLINHGVFEICFLLDIIYIMKRDGCIKDAYSDVLSNIILLYCETSFLFVASFFECFVASKALK